MEETNDGLDQLISKLDVLLRKHENLSQDINDLRMEITLLKKSKTSDIQPKPEVVKPVKPDENIVFSSKKADTPPVNVPPVQAVNLPPPAMSSAPAQPRPAPVKSDLEKFIGENLINKIGIAITVIGVGIGVKYSIEHQLISPLTRVILGYLVAGGLLGFGIKLKKDYENYSAVLVSGAIAIMYFITFAAYSFYNLIPQLLAFGLMVVFTAFSVVAAINYNRQVIAHIGLVGAYAVPFLLSDGSGRVGILFTYMAIINAGVLVIAYKRYWKPLYYSSFAFTWIIFLAWYLSDYRGASHFEIALVFLSVFFAIFYAVFLIYKLLAKEKFNTGDIIMLLLNSFLFYGLGYAILDAHSKAEHFLGLFTLANAVVHFIVSMVIYKQQLADRNLYFLVAGLVLVFLTIAIPVQLDGNWVTLLWAAEASLLFWIGRTKDVSVYERISYVMMLLAFFSLLEDWSSVATTLHVNYYPDGTHSLETAFKPLINIGFLSSLIFIGCFAFINYINHTKEIVTEGRLRKSIDGIVSIMMPGILLLVIYFTFHNELSWYWDQRFFDSAIQVKMTDMEYYETQWNHELRLFKTMWQINYALLFFSVLSVINFIKVRNKTLGTINIVVNSLVILVFLSEGLYVLSELRESYLSLAPSAYYPVTSFYIGIRYVSLAFLVLMLTVIYRYIRQDFMKPSFFNLNLLFDTLLYVSIIWFASSELIAWMDMARSEQSYKLGLSILWGVYSLALIALGIWKKKQHLRIGAFILFGATLIKLFFYDLISLNTISKTIVFVSLGVLLLIISFLYNKYKKLIAEEDEI